MIPNSIHHYLKIFTNEVYNAGTYYIHYIVYNDYGSMVYEISI